MVVHDHDFEQEWMAAWLSTEKKVKPKRLHPGAVLENDATL